MVVPDASETMFTDGTQGFMNNGNSTNQTGTGMDQYF